MKIFIDGSHTFCTTRNTGIERVVRMLAQHLNIAANSQNLSTQKVIHYQGRFIDLNDQFHTALQHLQDFERNPNVFMPKFARWGIAKATSFPPFKPLRKILLPEPSHLGIYKLPYRFLTRATIRNWARANKSIEWNEGDILLLPDAYWTKREIWPAIQDAKRAGAKVVSVFYDLIPITHPEFVASGRTEKFEHYVHELIRHSDSVLAISRTVRDELRQYIDETFGAGSFDTNKIDYFRLGADFSNATGRVRQHVIDYFAPDKNSLRPYIVVGSLDPRKNHVQVIDAFERLAEQHTPRRICFIGRAVGNSEELDQRMQRSPLANHLLINFRDLSDAELQYAYAQAQAVIMPSKVEGFGLPIVEALWHGANVIASDIPVHREVGSDLCNYFPLEDAATLAKMILEQEDNGMRARTRVKPTTWQESAARVLEACQSESSRSLPQIAHR